MLDLLFTCIGKLNWNKLCIYYVYLHNVVLSWLKIVLPEAKNLKVTAKRSPTLIFVSCFFITGEIVLNRY